MNPIIPGLYRDEQYGKILVIWPEDILSPEWVTYTYTDSLTKQKIYTKEFIDLNTTHSHATKRFRLILPITWVT